MFNWLYRWFNVESVSFIDKTYHDKSKLIGIRRTGVKESDCHRLLDEDYARLQSRIYQLFGQCYIAQNVVVTQEGRNGYTMTVAMKHDPDMLPPPEALFMRPVKEGEVVLDNLPNEKEVAQVMSAVNDKAKEAAHKSTWDTGK